MMLKLYGLVDFLNKSVVVVEGRKIKKVYIQLILRVMFFFRTTLGV